jgi:hypothetical protein
MAMRTGLSAQVWPLATPAWQRNLSAAQGFQRGLTNLQLDFLKLA